MYVFARMFGFGTIFDILVPKMGPGGSGRCLKSFLEAVASSLTKNIKTNHKEGTLAIDKFVLSGPLAKKHVFWAGKHLWAGSGL